MHRLLTFAALASITACASRGRVTTAESAGDVASGPGITSAMAPAAAPIVIIVTSEYRGPLALYSVSEGVATRLGNLKGTPGERFQLPALVIPPGGLVLMAVPDQGDARATSGALRVSPGSVVELAIDASLAHARASIRSP